MRNTEIRMVNIAALIVRLNLWTGAMPMLSLWIWSGRLKSIQWSICMRGNIGIIAGSPNSGKTAFLLNFIRLNQNKHKIHLFSSEGGKEELRQRISKFDYPLDSWKFSAWERAGDFADVIKPDDINVIDYLEIHDEFYKIGGIIKSISDRLKNGFALIALQKNNGRDEGLGGSRGLEKPRLYLSMDAGRLKIVKGEVMGAEYQKSEWSQH